VLGNDDPLREALARHLVVERITTAEPTFPAGVPQAYLSSAGWEGGVGTHTEGAASLCAGWNKHCEGRFLLSLEFFRQMSI
jgi:hypothetical protein